MRHNIDHRKLGRTTEHRIAMLRNQTASLVRHDRITTTLCKAKELRRFAERLITLAKKDTLHARRLAARHVYDPEILKKLFGTLGPFYSNRPGGYTRILKLGFRKGDGAQEAIIELVGREPKFEEPAKGKKAAKKAHTSQERAERAERVEESKRGASLKHRGASMKHPEHDGEVKPEEPEASPAAPVAEETSAPPESPEGEK
jgi:large subunit ribosomal protein L17